MAYDKLGIRIGQFILGNSVVQFLDTVVVVSEVGIDGPVEVPDTQKSCVHIEFKSPVDHGSDIGPSVSVSV